MADADTDTSIRNRNRSRAEAVKYHRQCATMIVNNIWSVFSADNLNKFMVMLYYFVLDSIIYGLVYPMAVCMAFSYFLETNPDYKPTLELILILAYTLLTFLVHLRCMTSEHQFIKRFRSHSPDPFSLSILKFRDLLNMVTLLLTIYSLVDALRKLSLLSLLRSSSEPKKTLFDYLFGSTEEQEQDLEMKHLTGGVPYIFWSIIQELGIPVPNSFLISPAPPLMDIYLAQFLLTMAVMGTCIIKLIFFNSLYVLEFSMRQIADPLLEIINELDQIILQNQPQQLDVNANVLPPVRRHLHSLALLVL